MAGPEDQYQEFDELFSELGYETEPADSIPRPGAFGGSAPAPASAVSQAPSEDELNILEMLKELDGDALPSGAATSSTGEYMDLSGSRDDAPPASAYDADDFFPDVSAPVARPEPEDEEPGGFLAPAADESSIDDIFRSIEEDAAAKRAPQAPAPAGPTAAGDDISDFLRDLEGGADGAPPAAPAGDGADDMFGDDLDTAFGDETAAAPAAAAPAGGVDEFDFDSLLEPQPGDAEQQPVDDLGTPAGFDDLAAPAGDDDFLADLESVPAAGGGEEDLFGDADTGPAAAPAGDDFLDDLESLPPAGQDGGWDDGLGLGAAAGAAGAVAAGAAAGARAGGSDAGGGQEEELELSDDDLVRIQNSILMLTPGLQDAVRAAIVEDQLSRRDANMLVRMLLARKPADEIRAFLEQGTGGAIAETEEAPAWGGPPTAEDRRRPFSLFGSLLPLARIGLLVAAIVFVGFLLYLLILKPRSMGKDFYERGLAEISRGNYDEAEQHFKKGESYLGKDLEWYNRYGLAYRERPEEYARALGKFRDGLRWKPEDFGTRLNYSDTYVLAGEYPTALSNYRYMLHLFPEHPKVFEKLGDLELKLGDKQGDPERYKAARGWYEKIVAADWKNLDGQFKILLAFVRMDDLESVREKYKQILTIDPKAVHPEVVTELGRYYQSKELWSDSKAALERVLEKDWGWHQAHYLMGIMYRERRDHGRAIKHLEIAVKAQERNPDYNNELGEAYLGQPVPNVPDAEKHFNAAKEISTTFYKPYVNLGNLYFERMAAGDGGDLNLEDQYYQRAFENYRMAEKNLPSSFDQVKFFYNLGWLFYRNGEVTEALERWHRVYEKNPFHPVVSLAMGNAFLHLKKDELAIAEYQKIIRYYSVIANRIQEIRPENKRHYSVFVNLSYAYNNLGVARLAHYARTGQPESQKDALLDLWKARELSEKLKKEGHQYAKYNLNAVLRPNVKRELAIAPEENKYNLPKTLDYERQ